MSRAVQLLGLAESDVLNGQEFWPQMGALTYSDSDLNNDFPFFTPKLANARTDPREFGDSFFPFKVTISQMHAFNFRVEQVRLWTQNGYLNNVYYRHNFPTMDVPFPKNGEEQLLAGWPGCSIWDADNLDVGINIGYIQNFQERDANAANYIPYPTGNFPVLCASHAFATFSGLPGPDFDTGQNYFQPLACQFWRSCAYPFTRLEFQGTQGQVFSTVLYDLRNLSSPVGRDTGRKFRVDGWDGAATIWEYYTTETPPTPELEGDVYLSPFSFYTYRNEAGQALYNASTGKAFGSVPFSM